MWYLITRMPLHFAAIPNEKILNACNRFNLPLATLGDAKNALLG